MEHKAKQHIVFPVFTLLFITLPVFSTMETADPGAGSVLALVIPTLLFGITYLNLEIKSYHFSAILMWFICSAVTLVGPFSAETNLMQIVKYFSFVVFFVIVSNYRFTDKDIVFVTRGYIIVATVVAALIVLSYLFGYQHVHSGEGGSVYYMGRYSIGITGLYKNPNYLASFICVASFIVLYKLKKAKMKFKKQALYLGLFLLFFVSCFLTGTRISLIVLFIIVIALYVVSFFTFSLRSIIIPLLVVGIGFVLFGRQISNLFELYLGGRELLSDDAREIAWPLAMQFFYDNFLVGCGIDAWHHLSKGHAVVNIMNNLHNVFLEFLLNQGIIGSVFLVYTLLYGYGKTKKTDRFFLIILFLVTAIPLCFQNGVIAVNFWRFIIIYRLALNYSIQSKEGITYLFESR